MNIQYFKELLLKEKAQLVEGMSLIAVETHDIAGDWAVRTSPSGELEPDMMADAEEEKAANEDILATLEQRLMQVDKALGRIEDGTYGICKISGSQIEEKRLEADPAATTCLSHMNDSEGL
jgi:DnaK suppressor protein